MTGADVMIGYVLPSFSISDYYLSGRRYQCPDGVCTDTGQGGTNDLLASAGSTYVRPDGTGAMIIKFVRKLNTNDTVTDRVWSPDSNPIVWAKNPTPGIPIVQHGNHRFDRNRVSINFRTGSISPVVDLTVVHGFLMFFAWCFFVPIAAFIARYLKQTIGHPLWFHLHRGLVTLALTLSTIAFIIIITYTKDEHFKISHAKLGLFIVILGFINPLLGIAMSFTADASREHTPLLPDFLHWIFGWTLVALGIVNAFLGLSRFEFAPTGLWVVFFLYAYGVTFVLFGFLIKNLLQGKTGLGELTRGS